MKLEFLQKELERVSDWVRFSDRKIAFLIALDSLIISFIKINYNIWDFNNLEKIFFVLLLASIVASIIFIIYAVFPRLKNKSTNKSLFYFSNISEMKIIDFLEDMENLTEEKAKKQIIEQIHANSKIANQKMKNIEKSIASLILAILFMMIFLVIK
jgi:cell division protein FtsL